MQYRNTALNTKTRSLEEGYNTVVKTSATKKFLLNFGLELKNFVMNLSVVVNCILLFLQSFVWKQAICTVYTLSGQRG